MTKVKTREDELERTQVANNLYLETLGAEVKTLAEKSRDLQHATEKVKDQLHSTVPGMLTKIVTSSENDAFKSIKSSNFQWQREDLKVMMFLCVILFLIIFFLLKFQASIFFFQIIEG